MRVSTPALISGKHKISQRLRPHGHFSTHLDEISDLYTVAAVLAAILNTVALALIAATLAPISRSKRWWVRSFDFPRLQIACLLIVWLLISQLSTFFGIWPNRWLVVLILGCLAYQAIWIYPYTRLVKTEVPDATNDTEISLSLLSSNVLMTNRDSTRFIELVRYHKPDVIATLESDLWWQSKLDTIEGYPYRVQCPLDNLYGMHVLSQLPLEEANVDYLVDEEIPSISARIRLDDDILIKLHVLHPTPPAPGENDSSMDRDVELLVLAKALSDNRDHTIVMGDLNDVAWSKTTRLFRKISGLLDPRVGRGFFNTFHALKWYLRWPLDHVFMSSHFKVIELQRLPPINSDHFPMLIKLQVLNHQISGAEQRDIETDDKILEETMNSSVAKQANYPSGTSRA